MTHAPLQERQSRRFPTLLIVAAIITMTLLVGGILLWQLLSTDTTLDQKQGNEDSSTVTDETTFRDAQASLYEVAPAEWGTDELNQAYLVLNYAHDNGAHRLVLNWLNELERAAAAGVSIDQPAEGYDAAYRDRLRSEARQAIEGAEANGGPSGVSQ